MSQNARVGFPVISRLICLLTMRENSVGDADDVLHLAHAMDANDVRAGKH